MGWEAAIGAGLGILDTGLQMYSAREAWKKQKEALQHQHQWEVEDLRKAGLNPVLSATGGSGAGGLNMPMPNTSGLSNAARNMVDASFKEQQKDLVKAQVETQAATARNIEADTQKKQAETSVQQGMQKLIHWQTESAYENTRNQARVNNYFYNNPEIFDALQKNGINNFSGYAAILDHVGSTSARAVSDWIGDVREAYRDRRNRK